MNTTRTGSRRSSPRAVATFIGAALVLSAVPMASAGAQRPLVFVHGLGASGSWWSAAAQRFSTTFGSNVAVYTPDLASGATFETQADELDSYTAYLSSSNIAIAHSNGGLVSRTSSLRGHPWSGVVTVGTPHRGTALGANVLNGALFDEAFGTASAVASPFFVYAQFGSTREWAWLVGRTIGAAVWAIAAALPAFAASRGFDPQNAVLNEETPTASFLTQTLNSSTNLSREGSAIPQRIGFQVTVTTSDGIMEHGLGLSNYETYARVVYAAGDIFYTTGDYYSNYSDYNDPYWYDKQANAYLWYDAAFAMYTFDQNWCALIGAVNSAYQCTESDGVVEYGAQAFPAPTLLQRVVGPGHNAEPGDPAVLDGIDNVLRTNFGLQPPPPPPPVAVSVTGPTSVTGCTAGTWTASASGGSPPYTYSWTVEGGSYSTGSNNKFTYTNTGTTSSIFVTAKATDSKGSTALSSSFKTTVKLPCLY